MRVLFDVTHPVHVHMFRPMIAHLEQSGHDVKTLAREKDVTVPLLRAYGIAHSVIGKQSVGLGLLEEWSKRLFVVLREAKSFRPDLLIGESNPCIAQTARLLGKRSIVFLDTEHARVQNGLTIPFGDILCTPDCYPRYLGPGHVAYHGFKELIYLHPRNYSPDPASLEGLGVKESDKFSLVRMVSWSAAHDMGKKGIGSRVKEVIAGLEKHGRVLVSSEQPIPREIEDYRIVAPPDRMHDILYYSSLYLGDGASMAAEAAVLGVPSIYVSPLRLKYLEELERVHGLTVQLANSRQALAKAEEILQDKQSRSIWEGRRNRLLADAEDVRQFAINLVEGLLSSEMPRQVGVANG